MESDDDKLPVDMEPISDIFDPFYGPLTTEDIERIERHMNVLVSQLFNYKDPAALADELEAPLADKIDGYIAIADMVADDPMPYGLTSEEVDVLQQRMRELLRLVNDYYHRMN